MIADFGFLKEREHSEDFEEIKDSVKKQGITPRTLDSGRQKAPIWLNCGHELGGANRI